jgi:ATP-dependent RNA helicase DDX56/DBP9
MQESSQGVQALVLVPTRELAGQVGTVCKQLVSYCWDKINVAELSGNFSSAAEALRLKEEPQIVVSTPARIVSHCKAGNLSGMKSTLRTLVVDEADMILSFGYDDDLKQLLEYIPKLHHTMLMSATLSPEIDALKRLVLNKPAILKLKQKVEEMEYVENENSDESGSLGVPKISLTVEHFYIDFSKKQLSELYLYIYTLIRLKVLVGKTLFFVNDIENGFKLKLFFESFSIPSAVLNSELPVRTRLQTVKDFNNGMIDYLIATDESVDVSLDADENELKKKKKSRSDSDNGFGVARGIDFRFVNNVVNFDFPSSLKSYVHRVGRTGRGGNKGTALSFVREEDVAIFERVQEYYNLEFNCQTGLENPVTEVLKPLPVPYNSVNAFRYRVEDVFRGITKKSVKEARLKEIKLEMLRSTKLKAHFEDNPREKELLQTQNVLKPKMVRQHLKAIPKYLVPETLKTISCFSNSGDGNRLSEEPTKLPKSAAVFQSVRSNQKRKQIARQKKSDPLKSFSSKKARRV